MDCIGEDCLTLAFDVDITLDPNVEVVDDAAGEYVRLGRAGTGGISSSLGSFGLCRPIDIDSLRAAFDANDGRDGRFLSLGLSGDALGEEADEGVTGEGVLDDVDEAERANISLNDLRRARGVVGGALLTFSLPFVGVFASLDGDAANRLPDLNMVYSLI